MPKAKPTIAVSRRSVLARISRLPPDYYLKAVRSPKMQLKHGPYLLIDRQRNIVTRSAVDIEGLAREIACLEPYEYVEIETA